MIWNKRLALFNLAFFFLDHYSTPSQVAYEIYAQTRNNKASTSSEQTKNTLCDRSSNVKRTNRTNIKCHTNSLCPSPQTHADMNEERKKIDSIQPINFDTRQPRSEHKNLTRIQSSEINVSHRGKFRQLSVVVSIRC